MLCIGTDTSTSTDNDASWMTTILISERFTVILMLGSPKFMVHKVFNLINVERVKKYNVFALPKIPLNNF